MQSKVRENGATAGQRDPYYINPSGKKLRSRVAVLHHLVQDTDPSWQENAQTDKLRSSKRKHAGKTVAAELSQLQGAATSNAADGTAHEAKQGHVPDADTFNGAGKHANAVKRCRVQHAQTSNGTGKPARAAEKDQLQLQDSRPCRLPPPDRQGLASELVDLVRYALDVQRYALEVLGKHNST